MLKFILFNIFFLSNKFKMDNLNLDLQKELIDYGFGEDQINLALKMSNKKDEVIDL
jgi:hypothetical protein